MDPLSDILSMMAVNRVTPLRFESCGPYAMRFGSYEHIKFGAVLSGSSVSRSAANRSQSASGRVIVIC
jgi:hypothetical protein